MVGSRGWLVVVTLVACSGYPKPGRAIDADVTLTDSPGSTIDAPPDAWQGTLPTAGTTAVTGTTDVGQTLTATPSGFTLGNPPGTYHYTWERCTTSACTSSTPIGTDQATYVLTTSDGGAYIRCGVTVTNTCSLGCGTSAVAYSGAVGAVRRVILAKGGACSVNGCSSGCNFYAISVQGFAGGNHSITCNASNTTNPWDSYSATLPSNNFCCYGFPGKTTWATVDGLRSNNVTW